MFFALLCQKKGRNCYDKGVIVVLIFIVSVLVSSCGRGFGETKTYNLKPDDEEEYCYISEILVIINEKSCFYNNLYMLYPYRLCDFTVL